MSQHHMDAKIKMSIVRVTTVYYIILGFNETNQPY